MASDQHTQRGKEVFLQFTFFVSIQVFLVSKISSDLDLPLVAGYFH